MSCKRKGSLEGPQKEAVTESSLNKGSFFNRTKMLLCFQSYKIYNIGALLTVEHLTEPYLESV